MKGKAFPAKGPVGSMLYPTIRPLYIRYCGKGRKRAVRAEYDVEEPRWVEAGF